MDQSLKNIYQLKTDCNQITRVILYVQMYLCMPNYVVTHLWCTKSNIFISFSTITSTKLNCPQNRKPQNVVKFEDMGTWLHKRLPIQRGFCLSQSHGTLESKRFSINLVMIPWKQIVFSLVLNPWCAFLLMCFCKARLVKIRWNNIEKTWDKNLSLLKHRIGFVSSNLMVR